MKQVYLIMAVLCLFLIDLQAQKATCGTRISQKQAEYLSQFRGEHQRIQTSLRSEKFQLPIQVYMVSREDGTWGLSEEKLFMEMAYLNQYFEDAGI